jgi:hypothetical protein
MTIRAKIPGAVIPRRVFTQPGQKERNNLSVGGGACSDDMAASAGIHHGSGVAMDRPRNGFLKLLRPCLAGADLCYGLAGKFGTWAADFAIWCCFCGLRFDLDQTSGSAHVCWAAQAGVKWMKPKSCSKNLDKSHCALKTTDEQPPQQNRKCSPFSSSIPVALFCDKHRIEVYYLINTDE